MHALIQVRKDRLEEEAKSMMILYAELQTSIRNGFERWARRDEQMWKPQDFYPDFPQPKAATPRTVEQEIAAWRFGLTMAFKSKQAAN